MVIKRCSFSSTTNKVVGQPLLDGIRMHSRERAQEKHPMEVSFPQDLFKKGITSFADNMQNNDRLINNMYFNLFFQMLLVTLIYCKLMLVSSLYFNIANLNYISMS